MLQRLAENITDAGLIEHPMMKDFNRYLLASHYSTMEIVCKENGLDEIAARLVVSLLRYFFFFLTLFSTPNPTPFIFILFLFLNVFPSQFLW